MSEISTIAGFNKSFYDANTTTARYRIMKGTAGSGKSVNVAQDYIIKLSDPSYSWANLIVVRATEASNSTSTFSELLGAINRFNLSDIWEIRTSPMRMKCKVTGCEIIFRGCNDSRAIERIKSVTFPNGKLTWIWIEEATEITHSAFEILDDRLRGKMDAPDAYYQITLTFNPINAQHWIKRKLWDIDSPQHFKHSSTYLDNNWIDEAYNERMERRRLVDPEGYRVYGLGEWGNTGNNILTNYTITEVDQNIYNYDSVVMAQDFGYNHANALLLVGFRDGNLYVLKELYVHEKYTSEIIALADAMSLPSVPMYCDCAEPDRIKEWRQAGYRAVGVVKGKGSVKAQIDYLKQHKVHIDTSCVNTAREIQQWRWKKDSNGELIDEPLEVEDDAMAALRYSVEPLRRNRRMRSVSKRDVGL